MKNHILANLSMTIKKILFLTIILSFISIIGFSQANFPLLSSPCKILQQVGNLNLQIDYERPSVRNRIIFGELVPWGKIWRTGSGHCTKMSFDKNVKIGNQTINAGKYSLFTIPNKEEWIIILNSDTTLYGTFNYNEKKDVARFVVYPQKLNRFYETLTIDIDLIPNNAMIYLSWENTGVNFPIETFTDNEIQKYIDEELITGKSRDYDKISSAIDYLYFQNTDYNKLIKLAEEAIKNHESGFACRVLMETYEKQHYYKQAIEIAEKGIEIRKKKSEKNDPYLKRDIDEWNTYIDRIKLKMK